jgi:hypothetical protein
MIMPRNVRNFWIETNADGSEKTLGTGPKNKEGGFQTNIYIRNNGSVEKILSISGRADGNNLTLEINGIDGFLAQYKRVK